MPHGLLPATLPMASSSVAPPLGFRAAEGVRSAWSTGEGPFGRTPRRRRTAAMRAGIKYEQKALAYLRSHLGTSFRASQWFKFTDDSGLRYCQVDGIFVDYSDIYIFEVKYTFTPDAYYQLKKLYEPVVKVAFKPARIGHVLVCRRFDPLVAFPEKIQQTQLLTGWQAALHSIGVFEWRP